MEENKFKNILIKEQALSIIEEICLNSDIEEDIIQEIYKVAHCTKENCNHLDWQKEIKDRYFLYYNS